MDERTDSDVMAAAMARPIEFTAIFDRYYDRVHHCAARRLGGELAEAAGSGAGVNEEMFVLVGDSLRETGADPALRAALFEVATTIDGVRNLGPTVDHAGRAGIAVGITGGPQGYRTQRSLIFDPITYQLLAEEERVVETIDDGIPGGSVVGYATYLASGSVDELP